jgi:hypothetical protein
MEPNIENPPNPPEMQLPPEIPEPGFWRKLQLLFLEPLKLFESLKRKSSWWQPLVLFVVIQLAAGFIAQSHILPSMKQDLMDYLSTIPNMPEDAIQKASDGFDEASNITAFSVIKNTLGAFLMRGIVFFVVTSLLFFIGSIIFGGTAKYIKVMSLYAWIYPIWALGAIIITPLMIVKESYKVSLSPALFTVADPSSSVYFLLRNFSIFNIWAIILLGLGFSVIYGVTKSKGLIAVFMLWAVWIAINSFTPYLNFQAALMGLS